MHRSPSWSSWFSAILLVTLWGTVFAQTQPGPTFARDIAPIAYKNCSPCHRPGESGPFPLLTWQDFSRRKEQVLEVIQRRIMPPWLPARQKHSFANERRLTDAEIALFEKWISAGAPEGEAKDLPAEPEWVAGWRLGQPDLIVTMPEDYELTPEGPDTYRNFVMPIPIVQTQFIAAVEFRPGNDKAVHHAFIRFDKTSNSRKKDAEDSEPGFSGLHSPGTEVPDGFFMSWQPGKVPAKYPAGLCWPLAPGTDLVIQEHLRHTGKPEKVRSEVGFYFATAPPSITPAKLYLQNTKISIPAGATNHVVEDSINVPVDIQILGILPHAHYLAKSVESFARLPSGRKEPLLNIPRWDFNWQGDYAYKTPVMIPAGSTLHMRVTYDNSTNNPQNPSNPPKPVQYGLQSTDEMAEVWFQVLTRSKVDFERLQKQVAVRVAHDAVDYNNFILRASPNDPVAYFEKGKALMALGDFAAAKQNLNRSVEIKPSSDACYHLALLAEHGGDSATARQMYEEALRLNPDNFFAHNNLGLMKLEAGEFSEAIIHLKEAARINPGDPLPKENLELARRKAREAAAKLPAN